MLEKITKNTNMKTTLSTVLAAAVLVAGLSVSSFGGSASKAATNNNQGNATVLRETATAAPSSSPSASPSGSPSASPAATSGITITFDGNGGTVSSDDATRTLEKGDALGKLPKATRKGYTLAGWYTEAANGEKVTKKTELSAEANYTLYAQWKKVKVAKVKNFKIVNKRTRHIYMKFKAVSGAKGYQMAEANVKSMSGQTKFFIGATKGYFVDKNGKKVVYPRKKVYYYRVRAYKLDSTKSKVYGKWTAKKRVQIWV